MFCEKNVKNIQLWVTLRSDLPFASPKIFERPMLVILRVTVSLKSPFTSDYLYLQVDLKKKETEIFYF